MSEYLFAIALQFLEYLVFQVIQKLLVVIVIHLHSKIGYLVEQST